MSDPNQPQDPSAPPSAYRATPPLPPTYTAPPVPPAGVPTGVSSPAGPPDAIVSGFFRALFDFSFRTFITRRLASIFYLAGMIVIGLVAVIYFVGSLVAGFTYFQYNVGAGLLTVLIAIIVVPIGAFLSLLILRFWIEAVVALVAVAENTASLRNTPR